MGDSLKSIKNKDEQQIPAKVILWCVPRSISTALTKCFSFLPDTNIWFEPYVDACRFGKDAKYQDGAGAITGYIVDPILTEPDIYSCIGYDESHLSYTWCKKQLEEDCNIRRNVFVKDMAYAIEGRYDVIPNGYKHTFLIREPSKVLRSWKKGIYNISDGPFEAFKLSECPPAKVPPGLFFEESYNLYNYIKANYDPNPVVIDSDDLLMNPSAVLESYCRSIGFSYTEDLLQWEASSDIIKTWNVSKKNLQVFMKTFYSKALSSTKFMKPKPVIENNLSLDDQRCVEFCMPFYRSLFANRIGV